MMRALTALLCILLLSACSNAGQKSQEAYWFVFDNQPTTRAFAVEDNTPIINLNNDAADALDHNINSGELGDHSPIYVKRFTNDGNPNDHSRFGFIVANQLATRLAQRGLLITDGPPAMPSVAPQDDVVVLEPGADLPKSRTSVFLNKDKSVPTPAMLTGTYNVGEDVIYMTAKIIRLDNGAIVSAHTWTLPINDNTRKILPALVDDAGMKPTVDTRIPDAAP